MELIEGDNLDALEHLTCVFKLAYLDPPFGKNKNFKDLNGEFFDYTVDELLKHLSKRFTHLKRLVDGIILIHCDPTASHYIKVLADKYFDEFINEIIWKRATKTAKYKLAWDHDVILVYRNGNMTFHPQYKKLSKSTLRRYDKVDEKGRFCYRTITANGSMNVWYFGLGEKLPKPGRGYSWSKEKIENAIKDGVLFPHPKTKNLVYKSYLDDSNGAMVDDVWTDISYISTKEKINFPTQKPLELCRRFIRLYTDEGDKVLDLYAGSGSFSLAALELNRDPTLCDLNLEVAKKRIATSLNKN